MVPTFSSFHGVSGQTLAIDGSERPRIPAEETPAHIDLAPFLRQPIFVNRSVFLRGDVHAAEHAHVEAAERIEIGTILIAQPKTAEDARDGTEPGCESLDRIKGGTIDVY